MFRARMVMCWSDGKGSALSAFAGLLIQLTNKCFKAIQNMDRNQVFKIVRLSRLQIKLQKSLLSSMPENHLKRAADVRGNWSPNEIKIIERYIAEYNATSELSYFCMDFY